VLAVVAAGGAVAGRRWSQAHKQRVRDSRIAATHALVEALRARESRPRVLVQASGVGYYGDRGDDILTEASPAGAGFLAELARDWEAEAQMAAELGVRVVLLRTGAVLSPAGGMLPKLLTPEDGEQTFHCTTTRQLRITDLEYNADVVLAAKAAKEGSSAANEIEK